MMRETDAKTKWCPMARVYNPDLDEPSCTFNRFPTGGGPGDTNEYKAGCATREVNCIGSACMAWRWAMSGITKINNERLGYCGAFGKPD